MTARGYRVDPVGSSQGASNSTSAAPAAASAAAPPDAKTPEAAQLEKLKDLYDRGLITEEEYKNKRNEILRRM